MTSETLLEVVDSCTLATLPDGSKVILQINQALLDKNPEQHEALIQPHQMRAHGTAVDDCAKRHQNVRGEPGGQCITVPDRVIDLYFDGWKCYLRISLPSADDLKKYPIHELTSPLPYEPQNRRHSRRGTKNKTVTLEEWRARLGFPTENVTRHTIANTTQMVKTLQAETREYMRDHYKTRVLALRPRRINDTMYSDTFFSSVCSVRGYKCFQMFALKQSKVEFIKLMKKEAQAPEMYQDVIRDHGAPNRTVTDNAQVMTGTKWTAINRSYCIESGFTVPHHQHQNYAELQGGNFKLATIKLYHYTPWAPLIYWCYATQYLDMVRRSLSRNTLNWRTGHEAMNGDTPDISIFRFRWFAPVWYYAPSSSFPSSDKMLPGFCLGIAPNTGDGFSYTILPVKEYKDIPLTRSPVTLVRSVVRDRDMSSSVPPVVVESTTGLTFYNAEGDEIFSEEELDRQDEEDAMSISSSVSAESVDDTNRDSISLSLLDLEVFPIAEEPEIEDMEIDDPINVSTTPIQSPTEDPKDSNEPRAPIVSQSQIEVEDVDSDDEDDFIHSQEEDSLPTYSRLEYADDVVKDVNNHFSQGDDEPDEDIDSILDHRYVDGILELEVEFYTGETEWLDLEIVKDEDPHSVAQFILKSDLGPIMNGKHRRWARKFLRSLRRTMRRLFRVTDTGFSASTFDPTPSFPTCRTRRATAAAAAKAKTKPKKKAGNKQMGNFKYGLEIPKKWLDVIRIDAKSKNTKWQDAIHKEVAALLLHKCFDFRSPDFKPTSDYQYAPLNLVYDIKADLRYKARLVCNGCRVDPRGLSTRATVVKGISVRLLDLIAESQGLEVLCGDIGNAFIQAFTKEKVYTRCGPEFGSRHQCIAIISKALYGLTTSAERYRTLFADFLRGEGFKPTRYDRDVWMRLRDTNDGYDYICTHVDDFKIVAKDPHAWMDKIAKSFLVKESGPREYYLGNDYKFHDESNTWTYGCKTYAAEAVAQTERVFGCIAKQSTPLPPKDCHPETDDSPLLLLDEHRKYQMLLGQLQWLLTIGRPDLCQAVSSLNRFGSCPREYHLDLAVRAFGYVKTTINKCIAIDSRPLQYSRSFPNYEKLRPDFLEDYPDAKEEMDPNFPKAFGPILETTILVDSDHAHDLKTRRSITGLLAFVGSTPVHWMSKRQGSIASSTYAAEFSALRTATEEAMNIRYMLRCLGVNIGTKPTDVFGDNLSVIQNSQNPEADLSKKHVAISFHVVREAIAAGIICPYWLKGKYNLSDIMTKQIPKPEFVKHTDFIFWRPNFHIHDKNRIDENFDDDCAYA
jgi:hypothetical protein